jgi:hypothetical protein
MCTAESLAPGLSRLAIELAIAKLKKYKSPGSDQITAELIQAGGETLVTAVRKSYLVSGRSLLLHQLKKGDKTDCNNYRVTSLLSTPYKMLSNILLSRLSPYIDEVIQINY